MSHLGTTIFMFHSLYFMYRTTKVFLFFLQKSRIHHKREYPLLSTLNSSLHNLSYSKLCIGWKMGRPIRIFRVFGINLNNHPFYRFSVFFRFSYVCCHNSCFSTAFPYLFVLYLDFSTYQQCLHFE